MSETRDDLRTTYEIVAEGATVARGHCAAVDPLLVAEDAIGLMASLIAQDKESPYHDELEVRVDGLPVARLHSLLTEMPARLPRWRVSVSAARTDD